MTHAQPGPLADPPRERLRPDAVVRAALELLDEQGLDAVSVRGTAKRLGVRMNTVLWHAKTKARLLELMADAVVAGVALDGLPTAWEPRLRELAHRYRQALLAHRDGAALVTRSYPAEPAMLRLADTAVAALLDAGLGERTAAWGSWALLQQVLGQTQEEQAGPASARPQYAWALQSGRYPALGRAAPHLTGLTQDAEAVRAERFDFGLRLLLRSLREAAADGDGA